MQHAHGAALVNVQEEKCDECQPDSTGMQYRLPQTRDTVKATAVMTLAVMMAAKAKQDREKAELGAGESISDAQTKVSSE